MSQPRLTFILSAVIGVALGAIPVLGFVHGAVTTSLRKKAKVPYPHSYASMELCKENVCIDPGLCIALFRGVLSTLDGCIYAVY